LSTPGAPPLVFVVAGEPSGDVLAARLMAALKRRTAGRVRFAGVGGERMGAEGLDSLFPIRELALIGLAEVVPHLPRLARRLRETAAEITRLGPSVVVTVDSPGFTLRLARRVRGLGIPIVHYVAPQLWAWRPGRARALAHSVDRMMTLLPFEPAFFDGYGIASTFVGHPVLESGAGKGSAERFRAGHGLSADEPVLAVLPGSRRSEVQRLLPVFAESVRRLAQAMPRLVVALATVETVADDVRAAAARWPLRAIVVEGEERYDAFAASRAAITKSGTVTLELALAGVAMVVCYRLSPITAVLARRLIRVPKVALVNLLSERPVVPELLQDDCRAEAIAREALRLLDDEGVRDAQRAAFEVVVRALGGATPPPSERAAEVVLQAMAAH
jgi:lipid-A-disaccharide synthase